MNNLIVYYRKPGEQRWNHIQARDAAERERIVAGLIAEGYEVQNP